MALEQRFDLLLAVDHDLGVREVLGARAGALEAFVRGRPHFLQAEEIDVPAPIEEGQELRRAGLAAPGVQADQFHWLTEAPETRLR